MDNKQPDSAQGGMTNQPSGQGYPPPYGGQLYGPTSQQQVQSTTVLIQQPANQVMERGWSSGIFGCFEDCHSCMCVSFCPSCYATDLAQRMGESCCVPMCVPGYLITLRTKLRTQQNIKGSICDDCMTVMCCAPCVMCQLGRELNHVRVSPA